MSHVRGNWRKALRKNNLFPPCLVGTLTGMNKVSRQRAYQQRKLAEGLCPCCGKRPLVASLCAVCGVAKRLANRKKTGSNPQVKGGRGRPQVY